MWFFTTLFLGLSASAPKTDSIANFKDEDHWTRDKASSASLDESVLLGATTSAFQIEGAHQSDGKVMSIIDTYMQTLVENDEFFYPLDAADSYNNVERDIQNLKDIGAKSYSFSIASTRILADINGEANLKGLEYYRGILADLKSNGILPVVTLMDGDYPQAIEDKGGVRDPVFVEYFAQYSKIIFDNFANDADISWVTINNPQDFCTLGFTAQAAPNATDIVSGPYTCGHFMLLAHAKAVEQFRNGNFQGKIGINLLAPWGEPRSWEDAEHVDAAVRFLDFRLGWMAEPIFGSGDYPENMKMLVAKNNPPGTLPEFSEEEKALLQGSADFLGLDYYGAYVVHNNTALVERECAFLCDSEVLVIEDWRSRFDEDGSPIVYYGLKRVLKYIKDTFNNPEIFINELGASFTADYNDVQRINFLQGHLSQIQRARSEFSARVTRIHFFSLMDGLEYENGFLQTYGLFKTNYLASDKRTSIRRTGEWIRDWDRSFPQDERPSDSVKLENLFFGSATSAFQHESILVADRAWTVWDLMGIRGPQNSANILDHMEDDAKLMKKMKMTHYFFTISWARVFRNGFNETAMADQEILDLYRKYIEVLKANDIIPIVGLYNWDLPRDVVSEFEGWTTDEGVASFVRYGKAVVDEYGDLVDYWVTLNQPQRELMMSYELGLTPPMRPIGAPGVQAYKVAKNMLLGHADIYNYFKSRNYPGKMGISLSGDFHIPFSNTEDDIASAKLANEFFIDWLLHPLIDGKWPESMSENIHPITIGDGPSIKRLPAITIQEQNKLRGSFDFLGVEHGNYRMTAAGEPKTDINEISYAADRNVQEVLPWNSQQTSNLLQRVSYSSETVYDVLKYISNQTSKPIILMSGIAGESAAIDALEKRRGGIVDTARTTDEMMIQFTEATITQLSRAKEEGVNVIGYIHWNFVDGYQWITQNGEAWGLVGLDWSNASRERIVKPFGNWFTEFISNSLSSKRPERDYLSTVGKIDYWERDQIYVGKLPSSFGFGSATASYQVEGAWDEDGKGMNIWDWWVRYPITLPDGNEAERCRVMNCDTGDIACDSYHNIARDVQMAKDLNLGYYRFSINWARLFPDGYVNHEPLDGGVNYYNNLIDALLAEGIQPMVTLFHWDLPLKLHEDFDGFDSPTIQQIFADYAEVCFILFGDRVKHWFTFNEPHSYCWQGHDTGMFPPGMGDITGRNYYKCAHNMILSHAYAYKRYQDNYSSQGGLISITIDAFWAEPADKWSDADIDAAQRYLVHTIAHYVEPFYNGDYPPEMIERIQRISLAEGLEESRLPSFTEEEKSVLEGSIDFYSLQMYTSREVSAVPEDSQAYLDLKTKVEKFIEENKGTERKDLADLIQELAYWFRPGWYGDIGAWTAVDLEWESAESSWLQHTPWGLRRMLNWVHLRFPNSGGIWITENGWSDTADKTDPQRFMNIYQSFNEILKAIEVDGVEVHGTCIWSLMDNFEWTAGYNDSFGMYHVEFGEENPETWAKTSVPRVANLIADPSFEDPMQILEDTFTFGYFPADFVWGGYSNAYETEKRGQSEQTGETLWDVHQVHLIESSEIELTNQWTPPTLAADTLNHIREDIQTIKDLKLKSYTFSVSWSRLFPNDDTTLSTFQLDKYVELAEGLKNAGIEPIIVLYNWDMPQRFFENGGNGWDGDVVGRILPAFRDYTDAVVKATRHVVKKFIPFQNVGREVFDGYTDVNYPPKSATSENSALRVFSVISNIYLGHIVAHTQIKRNCGDCEIGFAFDPHSFVIPADENDTLDVAASRRYNDFVSGSLLLPMTEGKWPESVTATFPDLKPPSTVNDPGLFDFITVSYETTGLATFADEVYLKEGDVSTLSSHGNFWDAVGVKRYNDFISYQSAKKEQRYNPKGFHEFINAFLPENLGSQKFSLNIEWSSTSDYPTKLTGDSVIPEVNEGWGIGRSKYVNDEHQMYYFSTTINQVLYAVKTGVSVTGLSFNVFDKWNFGSMTHTADGLVRVDMSSSNRERTVKDSGWYLADLIEVNGYEERKQNCFYKAERDDFSGGSFPDDFEWSLATASYQIEGGWDEDGKGLNTWDVFSHWRKNDSLVSEIEIVPECRIDNCDNGDIACDSYHKWREDVQMIKDLGVTLYRFSLSWTRIIPTGYVEDGINQAGIDYYNNLINELIANGIEPVVTLYHWDLPQQLHDDFRGWLDYESGKMVKAFVDFSDVAFNAFGDRVKRWITLNEPAVQAREAYGTGEMAPGWVGQPYWCGHTMLLAHAESYHLYDQKYRQQQGGIIGITLSSGFAEGQQPWDPEYWRSAMYAVDFDLGWFAEPIFGSGDYPQRVKEKNGNITLSDIIRDLDVDIKDLPNFPGNNLEALQDFVQEFLDTFLPSFTEAQKARIRGSSDFFGLNHYTSSLSKPSDGYPGHGGGHCSNWPDTGSDWLRPNPWGYRKLLRYIKRKWNNPLIYVTENGVSDQEGPEINLDDKARTDFYQNYIGQMLRAINEDDVNVRMYTAWSLMDNFEWARGFSERFGLHWVDYTDPERPRYRKDSSYCIEHIARTNSVPGSNTTEYETCGKNLKEGGVSTENDNDVSYFRTSKNDNINKDDGLGVGGIVGIAVGCFLFGSLLSFLLTRFCCRDKVSSA